MVLRIKHGDGAARGHLKEFFFCSCALEEGFVEEKLEGRMVRE